MADFDRAQDRLFTEIEHPVGRNAQFAILIVWSGVKPVALNHFVPQGRPFRSFQKRSTSRAAPQPEDS